MCCSWLTMGAGSTSLFLRDGMFVVKRDGRHETVQFDKITARIKKLVRVTGRGAPPCRALLLFEAKAFAEVEFGGRAPLHASAVAVVWQVYGLDPNYVDPVVITQKVIQGVYSGVTTSELDELAAQTGELVGREG